MSSEPQPGREPSVAPRARTMTLLSLGFSIPLAIVIGGAVGLLLDRWLGTSPWLFLLWVGLGIVAGLRGVIRAAVSASGSDPPVNSGDRCP